MDGSGVLEDSTASLGSSSVLQPPLVGSRFNEAVKESPCRKTLDPRHWISLPNPLPPLLRSRTIFFKTTATSGTSKKFAEVSV